jgi:hypothetical protein
MRHFPLRECGYAVGFLAVLTAIYVGAYCATVDRAWRIKRVRDCALLSVGEVEFTASPEYPTDFLRGVFGPIHEIDRKLRPRFWSREGMTEDFGDLIVKMK